MFALVAADPATAGNLAELTQAAEVSLSYGLNRGATLTFTMPLNAPQASSILSGERLVKAYQITREGDRLLRGVFEVVTVEEQGSNTGKQSIQVQAVEAGTWRLLHRLVGKSAAGWEVTTATDRGLLAKAAIDRVNATTGTDGGGYTGLRVGTVRAGTTTTVSPAYRYKSALEVVNELAGGLTGFDWRIDPVDGEADAAGVTIGEFTCAPALGLVRDLVFEYGGGMANVADYRRQVSRDTLATSVYALAGTNAASVVVADSSSPALTGYSRYEAALSDTVTSEALRQSLAVSAVTLRSIPREVVTFTPLPDVVEFGTELLPGDTVLVRAKVDGDVRLDVVVRVYGIDVNLDELGRETLTLTLTPENL